MNYCSIFDLLLGLELPSSSSTLVFKPFIFLVCNLLKSCFAMWTRPLRSPISSSSLFFTLFPSPFSMSVFFIFGLFKACLRRSTSAERCRRIVKSIEGPIGTSSTRGMRVPEARSLIVYALKCTFGREDMSSWDEVAVLLSEEGVGPQVILITCSIPGRHIDSISSPLKNEVSIDLSWTKRGWVSKSSDAKCKSGLWPGVAFGVCFRLQWAFGTE